MKKGRLVVLGTGVFLAVVFCLTMQASAYKNAKAVYTPPETEDVAYAETVKSMSDCMTYSANHQSKGSASDKALFQKEFGAPLAANGATTEYSYDKYTKIILDCSSNKCNCRCLQKQ